MTLLELLDARLRAGRRIVDLVVPVEDGRALSYLYSHGEVLERDDGEAEIRLKVAMDDLDLARFEKL